MGFSDTITKIFLPILKPVFDPINNALGAVYTPWSTIFAVGLFVAAMIWVFAMRKEYVNLDAPSTHFWHDLRFWTILSMLPHVFVYFYFR
jgi:hypothetical protein